jgi:diaminohydroxyphosphoribosylaminopyrimidine deaminase/5-amino-6-(5-phosphoribosylamino)uracil reductase
VRALRAAGAEAAGATAYVTLEPCCHHGRTPPCTDALVAAGVSRVVAAMQDPDPRVAGRGLQALSAAGIRVEVGLCEDEARRMNGGFVSRVLRARPYVRTKLAASIDGATAMTGGESQWITGEAARADVQRWRARSSAILTGVGTVMQDDPRLTVRLAVRGWVPPLRVVLDTGLRMAPAARMLREPGSTLVFTGPEPDPERVRALGGSGAEIQSVARTEDGRVDLAAVLASLALRGVNDVLVEAGARLNGALLAAGLIDELVLYLAPIVLGRNTRGLFELPGLVGLDQGKRLELVEMRRIGTDMRIRARPAQ